MVVEVLRFVIIFIQSLVILIRVRSPLLNHFQRSRNDIYFVPLTVRGGLATTYWEYLDYSRGAMVGAADGNYAPGDFWTDGGRYLWHKKPALNWCVQLLAKIEPRIILLTPQLAGRLQNVQYCPLQHERTPFPGDPYFVNGGVSTARSGPSFYSDWNLPA